MEELEPNRFQWIFVLQALVVCAHCALPKCHFACYTQDETDK